MQPKHETHYNFHTPIATTILTLCACLQLASQEVVNLVEVTPPMATYTSPKGEVDSHNTKRGKACTNTSVATLACSPLLTWSFFRLSKGYDR